ncbi:MAG TPA: lysyl oxidase family protein [Actinomycetota bacterium]|nr:lysyl oxidase family protein [Actinomycetota bacterium]
MKRAIIVGLAGILWLAAAPVARPQTPTLADQLPNLVPLAPEDIEIRQVDGGGEPALRFSVWIANEGDYAFELVARAQDYSARSDALAEQCIAWAGPRACTERRSIGTLSYHQAHGHYHFEDFALYELRRVAAPGRPDMSERGLVRTSEKVSFCLQDVQRRDGVDPLYATPWPLYYGCFAGQGVQGISPGWVDIYSWGTPGQQIPLKGIADGTYALVLYTDPGNRVFETNDSDNMSIAIVDLLRGGKKVRVVCTSPPGTLSCG